MIGTYWNNLFIESYDNNLKKYKCICKCGKIVFHKKYSLLKSKSCGCFHYKDLTGKKYCKLTFRKKVENKWEVICDCGNVKYYYAKTFGKITSCGCIKKEVNINNLQKAYSKRKIDIFSKLKKMYKKQYSDGDISFEEFYKLSQMNCYYCGIKPSNLCKNKNSEIYYNGLDRVDNNIGHFINNCVTCCKYCNIMKNNYHLDDFKNWITKISFNSSKIEIKEIVEIKELKRIWKEIYYDVSFKEFSYLSQMNCYYCNSFHSNKINNKTYNGLDRTNNNLGHTIDNVVPCCVRCNFAKNNRSIEDFYSHIKNIKINLGLNGQSS